MRHGWVLLLLCFSLLLLTAWAEAGMPPPFYSAEPIRGTMVEAGTGRPLEGVIVVAQWILYSTGAGGQNPYKRLRVLETVTAADGTYSFPGWGPTPNPITIDDRALYKCCFFESYDPVMDFFTPGYRPRVLHNKGPLDIERPARASDWDGKTVELERFKGSVAEWGKARLPSEYPGLVHLGLASLSSNGPCH